MKIYRIAQEKDPSKMTEEEFMDYHNTGYIRENAYDSYKTVEGLKWLKKENFPILHSVKQFGGKTIEFRQSGDKNQYGKTTTPDKEGWTEYLRDERGNIINLTDEEIKEKGYQLYETTIVAFDGDIAIGFASDEFGADGIWVVEAYRRQGIGLYLLTELRKYYDSSRKMGQMTNSGNQLARAYYKRLKVK